MHGRRLGCNEMFDDLSSQQFLTHARSFVRSGYHFTKSIICVVVLVCTISWRSKLKQPGNNARYIYSSMTISSYRVWVYFWSRIRSSLAIAYVQKSVSAKLRQFATYYFWRVWIRMQPNLSFFPITCFVVISEQTQLHLLIWFRKYELFARKHHPSSSNFLSAVTSTMHFLWLVDRFFAQRKLDFEKSFMHYVS